MHGHARSVDGVGRAITVAACEPGAMTLASAAPCVQQRGGGRSIGAAGQARPGLAWPGRGEGPCAVGQLLIALALVPSCGGVGGRQVQF